ncbi:SHOCT domain-containing protein [Aneurinibacillus sp. Ricciae_BoGa-3]|uniref:SHOCT domain-containing protein n=1 Tax=Aneurinibacillus sp. Ricciae_BoGa-3 TaxID=3022697 RepID=UPI002341ABF2|nr:SHOCT domain-containing protein [Aneurinibacillus sp. Ricciae_BoGa-3]WCK52978.1 SHOCT domain-containing protein [Aneurinibacillus sp. Ricciae_BoGa-3]
MNNGMMNGSSMMGGSMMIGMGLMMLLGILLLIIVVGLTIYFVVRFLIRKNKVEDHPLMILNERYVKGEISEEEYKEKRKLLKKV